MRSTHSGQGTANAIFCFDSAYLQSLGAWDDTQLETGLLMERADVGKYCYF